MESENICVSMNVGLDLDGDGVFGAGGGGDNGDCDGEEVKGADQDHPEGEEGQPDISVLQVGMYAAHE